MNYIDIDKLGVSPSSAITEVIAVDANDNIIKADFQPAVTKEEFLELGSSVVSIDNEVNTLNVNLGTAIKSLEFGTSNYNTYDQVLRCKRFDNITFETALQPVTQNSNGVMTPTMLNQLNNAGATNIQWGANSNINDYKEPGVYYITGERLNANDNIPINNSNPGHTISGRLFVLDSSINGTGDNQDKCITQVLMLSNRTGGDGNVYTRTAQGSSYNNLVWEQWGKLQTNIEVGIIDSYDDLTDNGIYSGIYSNGTSVFDTFVMLTINNYPVAGQAGVKETITQILFVLHIDGTFEALKRRSYYTTVSNEFRWKPFTPLNGGIYGDNYPIAPDISKLGSQKMRYYNADFEIQTFASTERQGFNNAFYNYIKDLLNQNQYNTIDVITETVEFRNYGDSGGSNLILYGDLYIENRNGLVRYIKLRLEYSSFVNGLKVIQDIVIS